MLSNIQMESVENFECRAATVEYNNIDIEEVVFGEDSPSNTLLIGKFFRLINEHGYYWKFNEFLDDFGLIKLPIINMATAITSNDYCSVIIRINQGVYNYNNGWSLLSTFQFRLPHMRIDTTLVDFYSKSPFGLVYPTMKLMITPSSLIYVALHPGVW